MARLSSNSQGVTKTIDPRSAGKAGFVQAYAGATAPSGWKVCDGSAVSRTDYSQLFANIGTKYGVGDGSTTFNLPDGPSDSFWVDLDVTGTNWTTGSAKGKVTNFDGVYALDFQIKGTTSSAVSNIAVQIGGVSISAAQSSSGWSQQSGVADRITLFVRENAGGLQIASSGGNSNSWSMNGGVLLTGKPTDAFVGADSRFSTFDEALESQTIIKLYDDSTTAVSVSVAEATEDTAGVAKTSEAADDTQQYLVPDVRISGEGDLGSINNWATVDSKKYRWYVIGKICFYEQRVESATPSTSNVLVYNLLPSDVPTPKLLSNAVDSEWAIPASSLRSTAINGSLSDSSSGAIYPSGGDFRVYGYTDVAQGTRVWALSAFWQID